MSNNIIKFPTPKKRRKKLTDVLVDRVTPTHQHVSLGTVPFTCPECKQVAGFDFTNLIFKTIQFYCSSCGHGYHVSNPMFSNSETVISSLKRKG